MCVLTTPSCTLCDRQSNWLCSVNRVRLELHHFLPCCTSARQPPSVSPGNRQQNRWPSSRAHPSFGAAVCHARLLHKSPAQRPKIHRHPHLSSQSLWLDMHQWTTRGILLTTARHKITTLHCQERFTAVFHFPSIVPSVNRCYSLVSTAERRERAGCAILSLKRNGRQGQNVCRQNFNTTLGGERKC